jgi:tetratricopeptide (TPR) repeat protein
MKQYLLWGCLMAFVAIPAAGQQKKSKSKPGMAAADSLFLRQDYATAAPIYEALLKESVNKGNAQAWNRLGVSYVNLKNYASAIKTFDEVYKINPRFPQLFVNRAKAYSAMGDITKSVQMLDSATQRYFFGNFRILENDPAFENLRKDARYKEVYDRVYAAAYPCLNLPQSRQFDFWIGEWDVYVTTNLNIKAGVNKITQQPGGCVLLESWEAQGPHRGVSINYYDPADSTWKQKWAGSGQDIVEFYDGRYEEGVMRFKSNVPNGDGTYSQGKLTFTNIEPGKVRQHSERSPDGGKTWQTVYDFTYIRRKN